MLCSVCTPATHMWVCVSVVCVCMCVTFRWKEALQQSKVFIHTVQSVGICLPPHFRETNHIKNNTRECSKFEKKKKLISNVPSAIRTVLIHFSKYYLHTELTLMVECVCMHFLVQLLGRPVGIGFTHNVRDGVLSPRYPLSVACGCLSGRQHP